MERTQYWAEQALSRLRPTFDPQKPTALFLGRYQPFHSGHQRLIEEGLRRVGQACIAVRDTHGIDEKNPLPFFSVKQRIEIALSAYIGRFVVVRYPTSPTCSMAATSGTRLSESFSTSPPRRYPPHICGA